MHGVTQVKSIMHRQICNVDIKMIDITAELLNEITWFDGIIYIILGLLIYTAKKIY